MINPLIDFFLLISTDKKSITCNNLSTFYQFITKKLPEIESHRPNLITSSLYQQNSQKNNNEKPIKSFVNQNKDIINKINKNFELIEFQNELLSLFYDMIDYLYEEKNIILSEDKKNILTKRIMEKFKEKKLMNKKINNKFNNILIQNIQNIQTRKYLLELIITNTIYSNNFLLFNFTITNYINFINNKNINKNRYIIDKFMKVIIPVIKIYKTDTKNSHAKKNSKLKTKSLCKLQVLNINFSKNNINNNINNNIFKGYTTKNKNSKNINQYFHKINNSYNNKKKEFFNLNNIFINKNKSNKKPNNQSQIKQNENYINDKNNMTKDTIPCQTLKNCYSFDKISKSNLKVNYLSNIIKKINTDNNKNNKNIRTHEIKNKIKYFYPKRQVDNLKMKNKSVLYRFKKNTIGNGNENNESEIYNNNSIENKNRSSYMDLVNKKYNNILNESNNGCLIH